MLHSNLDFRLKSKVNHQAMNIALVDIDHDHDNLVECATIGTVLVHLESQAMFN